MVIKVDRKNRLINLSEILYIESLADYVIIHLADDQIITKEKIGELDHKLPNYFIRVHRSFLVNRNHVKSFGKSELIIGEVKIRISRKYKESVQAALEI